MVVAWPLSMRNEAESWVRSVVCSLPSCHPDSGLEVSERIICATLRPWIAPSWKFANTVPQRFDMIARWLDAGGAHRDLRLHLAVELVEVGGAAQQRQRAHADEIAAHRVSGRAAGDVDVDFAVGLAAIGAEIRNRAFENAAGERGVDRGGRKMAHLPMLSSAAETRTWAST